jgi:hypothetical protein
MGKRGGAADCASGTAALVVFAGFIVNTTHFFANIEQGYGVSCPLMILLRLTNSQRHFAGCFDKQNGAYS